ncbi:hypothetical protein GGI09_005082 [Coemansia sp. S100]|nr:hypothetical protein GGI09_005082 [Coemansia sp. S100]
MFTKGQPEEKPLAALKDKQLVADVYQQTIDVELELSGIRQGWVSLKKVMIDLGERKKPIVVETTVPDPLNPGQSVTHSYTEWVEDVKLGMIRRTSVPSLIYLAICSALIFLPMPAFIRLVARLWSTPISRWIGASRSTVAILLIGSTINTIWLIAKSKTTLIVLKPELVAAAFIAAKLDDMTFAPWVALSQLCRRIFWRRPSPDIARSSSAQQLSLIAENKEELDSTSVSVASNPYFRQPEPVIAIRREVDDIAMRWVHLLTLPVIAMSALYMLVEQGGKFWSWAFIEGVFAWSTRVFFCVAWLPQIIINYKTKSGSLTPVTYNIIELSASVLAFISDYLMGGDMLQD